MLTRKEYMKARAKAVEMIRGAGIAITEEETENIEVVDFGLGHLAVEGAQILTFFSTARVSVKVIALFPYQTEPEHWHPAIGDDPGKEETIRVVWGTVRFYLPGEPTASPEAIPPGKESFYTVRHEVLLHPCQQLTIEPGTKHWFKAGPEGAVMYSFSTCARDVMDRFSDPAVVRLPQIVEG
ncbi:MAG: D-lyxose/D-mannose family sugar isomerase [Firmicutes bacterium]|nr:D-lyxose/D-mannose family sugar isomerase [Bacillota bacterium]